MQLDLPKFEAVHAQVLGVSVDFAAVNKAWAEQLGLTYPLLSDASRTMSRAYGVLYDDPKMADDPQQIRRYLRCMHAWFVIDSKGVIQYVKRLAPGARDPVPNDEILTLLQALQ